MKIGSGVVVLAALALVAAGWTSAGDPPSAGVLAPPRLIAAPASAINQCRLAQARMREAVVLCPSELPQATVARLGTAAGTPPPRLISERTMYVDAGGKNERLTFTYGDVWEPVSGAGWQSHLWRNRPCCYLHFEIFTRTHRPFRTFGGRAATLGGHRGIYEPAIARTLDCSNPERTFWCDHAAFVWRERGVSYAATLLDFGAGTKELLGRLIAGLRPAPR